MLRMTSWRRFLLTATHKCTCICPWRVCGVYVCSVYVCTFVVCTSALQRVYGMGCLCGAFGVLEISSVTYLLCI